MTNVFTIKGITDWRARRVVRVCGHAVMQKREKHRVALKISISMRNGQMKKPKSTSLTGLWKTQPITGRILKPEQISSFGEDILATSVSQCVTKPRTQADQCLSQLTMKRNLRSRIRYAWIGPVASSISMLTTIRELANVIRANGTSVIVARMYLQPWVA